MKFIFSTLFIFSAHLVFAQHNPSWNYYFGDDIITTKQKLNEYLGFYHYKALISENDSTLKLTITHDLTLWTIYSVFYFDHQGKCYALSNRRCDSIGLKQLQHFLSDKNYKWTKISINKYLSKFSVSELLEVIDNKNCSEYKRTKLKLTEKQYKALRNSSTDLHL
jgi:hypothetical protein